MDPPDVLGFDSGTARPTKLPNRAKSNLFLFDLTVVMLDLKLMVKSNKLCF